MKKLIALVLALIMVLALCACGGDTATAPAPEAAKEEAAPAPVEEAKEEAAPAPAEEEAAAPAEGGTYCTDETPVVTLYGDFTAANVNGNVLVTNVGQNADSATMESLMKKAGAAYDTNNLATAEDVTSYGTVIVVCGASGKGLGSAGISQEEELARAEELLKACKDNGITVILAHLGGSGRRGTTSDQFIEVVMGSADYMLVVEDGNFDGFFTDYCEKNNVPLTLVKSAKNAASLVGDLFA